MVYLVGVLVVATRLGRAQAIAASVASVAAFDFFFVPPHLSFSVASTQHLLTFVIMLGAALVMGGMASRIRQQAVAGRERERRTEALLGLARVLAGAAGQRADLRGDGALGRGVARGRGRRARANTLGRARTASRNARRRYPVCRRADGRALGPRSRAAGRPRHRHAARDRGPPGAGGGRRTRLRGAGDPLGRAPSAGPGSPDRGVRQPGGRGARAQPPRRRGARGRGPGRGRALSQRPAVGGVARPAHPARSHRRAPRAACSEASSATPSATSWRAPSTTRAGGWSACWPTSSR